MSAKSYFSKYTVDVFIASLNAGNADKLWAARQAIRCVNCWCYGPSRDVIPNGHFRTIYHIVCLKEIEFQAHMLPRKLMLCLLIKFYFTVGNFIGTAIKKECYDKTLIKTKILFSYSYLLFKNIMSQNATSAVKQQPYVLSKFEFLVY